MCKGSGSGAYEWVTERELALTDAMKRVLLRGCCQRMAMLAAGLQSRKGEGMRIDGVTDHLQRDNVKWVKGHVGVIAAEEGRESREITVDKEWLLKGVVVPVDAETGATLNYVRSARIETHWDDLCILRVDFILTAPYPREEKPAGDSPKEVNGPHDHLHP
jgi:hypothetical protein